MLGDVPQLFSMELLRLFIAIETDQALRNELSRTQRRIQDAMRLGKVSSNPLRWVAPQAMHITLKFLGNCEPAQVPNISAALARAAAEVPQFSLSVSGLGSFANAGMVIWAGLEGDIDAANLLARKIDAECAMLGFARDQHGFAPHLTLGRMKRPGSPEERRAIEALIKSLPAEMIGMLPAKAIHLISSDLRPTGPIYRTLGTFKLVKP